MQLNNFASVDTMQIYDCSIEDTLLEVLANPVKVHFHKQDQDEAMVIFIFDRIIHLNWYVEFSKCVSPQTTFLKITETRTNKIDISFIDSVFDYHITVPDLNYDKLQLDRFKSEMPQSKPLLLVVGIMDNESNKPIVITPSDKRNLPILITLGGYLELS